LVTLVTEGASPRNQEKKIGHRKHPLDKPNWCLFGDFQNSTTTRKCSGVFLPFFFRCGGCQEPKQNHVFCEHKSNGAASRTSREIADLVPHGGNEGPARSKEPCLGADGPNYCMRSCEPWTAAEGCHRWGDPRTARTQKRLGKKKRAVAY